MSKKYQLVVILSTIVCFVLVAQVACRDVSEDAIDYAENRGPLGDLEQLPDAGQFTNEAGGAATSDRQGRGMFGNWRFFFNPYNNYSSSNYGPYNQNYQNYPNNQNNVRDPKLFSLFTPVKFSNAECRTSNGENGTCFAASECSARGGVANGPCSNGFGVCCTFSYTCGQTTHQNNSVFFNPNYPSTYDGTGSCQLTVNKVLYNVCQVRLDFWVLNLMQPEGNDSICNRDQFIVTGGSRVPSICGANTGQHMYVEMGLLGNSPLTLTIVTSGSGFARQWRIRVAQLTCDSLARAPNSCLQYFTGVSGTIKSFNYDGINGRQLSNQDYSICVRTESNFCSIAYTVCNNSPFSITGGSQQQSTTTPTSTVGALVGSTSCTSDWITIPCASDNGRFIQSGGTVCQDRLCGDLFASVATQSGQTSGTVISQTRPFTIAVHFDGFEANIPTGSTSGATAQFNNRGFCLNYIQQPCTS